MTSDAGWRVRGQWSSGFEMLVLGVLVAAAAYASGAAVRALLT